MDKYAVTGMSCAACSSHVEKAVKNVSGVTSVTVSLLTNSMTVEGTASASDIIAAVKDAGYGAFPSGNDRSVSASMDEDAFADHETPKLLRRLIVSVCVLLPLMYVSMGHMMWNWPLPESFAENHVAMGLYEMLLAIFIMIINQKFFISGFKSLIHKSPNMDTLVAMGSAASFAYSTYALFAMTGAVLRSDSAAVMTYMDEFYFESAAMILTLITIGKTLESYSKGKTTNALKSLVQLAPKTATVLREEQEMILPVDQVHIGDIFLVRPGERIPVDGIVLEGDSAVDESALTGESIPVDKSSGNTISAATMNQSGFLKCQATRVGEDTTLSQIIQMVSDASATKAPIAKIADKVSGIFVPSVLSIAAVTFIIWILVGQEFSFALSRAISVLVISCPCALGLATPVAIMVGNGVGAKKGVLFKTAISLEETGKTDIIALDKTGTITCGTPKVTDIIPASGMDEDSLLRIAFALEQKSEHPLAKAIVDYTGNQNLNVSAVERFQAVSGNGLSGMQDGIALYGGNDSFIQTIVEIPIAMKEKAVALAEAGKTPLYFARGNALCGMIAVADTIKDDSPEAITQLKQMGIWVVMLTGDNERTARAIGAEAGVDEVIAGVLPDGKEAVIRNLQEFGKVAMVGDGINDAPALTRANAGIAIGAGADVALDAADVVLVKSKLTDVAAAIRLSRSVLRNIHENLFWAFFYNVIGIPLAAGCYYAAFGLKLNPMFGAAAMSLSSFCVVMNALRLNWLKLQNTDKDKSKKNSVRSEMEKRKLRKTEALNDTNNDTNDINDTMEMENNTMEKTIVIKGMMCPHCEAHVKKALEAMEGLESAVVSHEKGTAVVTLSKDIEDAAFQKVIEDADYEFIEVK